MLSSNRPCAAGEHRACVRPLWHRTPGRTDQLGQLRTAPAAAVLWQHTTICARRHRGQMWRPGQRVAAMSPLADKR